MADLSKLTLVELFTEALTGELTGYESDGSILTTATVSADHGGTISSQAGSDRLIVAPPAYVSDGVSGTPAEHSKTAMLFVAWLLYRLWRENEADTSADPVCTRRIFVGNTTTYVTYTVKLEVPSSSSYGSYTSSLVADNFT